MRKRQNGFHAIKNAILARTDTFAGVEATLDYDALIVGGGAAGFFAAIHCAEARPEWRVAIVERGKDTLQKVRISGGGRCNVTHAVWEPRELVKYYPRGGKALRGPFSRFCTGDTVEWFERRGVELKIEADGRMFPKSNKSTSIMRALREAAERAGVVTWLSKNVQRIQAPTDTQPHWQLTAGVDVFRAPRLLIATGSNTRVWSLIEQHAHTIVPPVPSLFTFNTKDTRLRDLSGLSMPTAKLRVMGTKLQSDGPLLITHWGLSGPAVLKLSAWGARELQALDYRFELRVNWLGRATDEIREALRQHKTELTKKQVQKTPLFGVPRRLWESLTNAATIPPTLRWAELGKKALNKLAMELTDAPFNIAGKSTFKEEFVTAGGIALHEVDFKAFRSKKHDTLYFAGEVLDIDAVTGGFNFQAAWTGGYLAGRAMAEQAV